MKILYPILLLLLFIMEGCNPQNINDASKRNEDWVWWVDAKTKKGEWIPVGDKRTVKNGEFTYFYSHGQICAHGRLKDGKEIDTTFFYSYDGPINKYIVYRPDTSYAYFPINGDYRGFTNTEKPIEEGVVNNHQRGGIWTNYYEDGIISKRKRIGSDNKGWITRYYDYSGSPKDSTYYTENEQSGLSVSWFDDGRIKEISNWKMGIKDGDFITYYGNGNPELKGSYINGKTVGKLIYYFEKGGIKRIANFKDSILEGEFLDYYPEGELKCHAMFHKGKQQDAATTYLENGTVISKMNLADGQLEGRQLIYYANGKLRADLIVTNKEFKSYQLYDSTGTKMNFSDEMEMKRTLRAVLKEISKNIGD